MFLKKSLLLLISFAILLCGCGQDFGKGATEPPIKDFKLPKDAVLVFNEKNESSYAAARNITLDIEKDCSLVVDLKVEKSNYNIKVVDSAGETCFSATDIGEDSSYLVEGVKAGDCKVYMEYKDFYGELSIYTV